MELVYCVDINKSVSQKDWVSEERCCSTLSCRNILCLSKLAETDSSNEFDHQYDVVVLDLDKPWEPHLVTKVTTHVVQLEWNAMGTKLLIVDTDGECQVWAMENHLLNRWVCTGKVTEAGEEVLAVMWFHNGLQIVFDPDKRDKTQYMDKFSHNTRVQPSLTQYGGGHVEGWILVTASGLVSVSVIMDDSEIITSTQNLAPVHLRLTSADVSNTGSGEIMVATSDGQLTSAIQCFLISLKLVHNTIDISCRNCASMYMKTQMEYGNKENQEMRITTVMFMNRDSSDTLFICCGSAVCSCLEVWQLLEQMVPLHKIFSATTAPDTMNKTHKWMHKATIPHPSLLTSIAGPKLPMSRNLVETTGFLPFIATSYKDGVIQLIHRYTFQVISSSNADNICQQVQPYMSSQTFDKRQKSMIQMSAMVQTASGCGLIGLHAGRLYLLRTYNSSGDSTMQLPAPSIVVLLEYAMVTGLDWWDIFLSIRQGMIMSISQSLSDNYSKQVHHMQDYVFVRLLSMKMGLFSSYSAGHQKAIDYHARLVLHAIGNSIKGILKPRVISATDKSPAEKVSLLCNKHTEGDVDTIVASLDPEEFLIDMKKDKSEVSLYNIQPLIQWVADFSLQLLASVPLFQSYSQFMGSSLLNDQAVLNLLRELIVIFKVWGLTCPGSMPSFTTTAVNLDLLKHMFKLLTRAWACCKDGCTIEFDDSLQDECSVLPSKVLIPCMNQSFRMDSNGFSVFTQQLPLMFEFGETPEYLYQKKKSKAYKILADSVSVNCQQHDVVRQVHLGTKLSECTRQCSRCGCQSLLKTMAKSQIMKGWEKRWAEQCLCGGHWKCMK